MDNIEIIKKMYNDKKKYFLKVKDFDSKLSEKAYIELGTITQILAKLGVQPD